VADDVIEAHLLNAGFDTHAVAFVSGDVNTPF
jgi:hypothetical protein